MSVWRALFGLLLMSLTTSLGLSQERPCDSYVGTCDYYQCLSQELNCKEKEYPLAFGYKYCEKFDLQADKYSEKGKLFLEQVRECLQTEIQNTPELTCKKAKDLSPAHHVTCYRLAQYCDLSLKDKVLISRTVIRKMLSDPKFQLTALKILKCKSVDPKTNATENLSGIAFPTTVEL